MIRARTAILGAVVVLGLGCGGGSGGDPIPVPAVVTRSPVPGATEATDTSVTVAFSEAMDLASLQAGFTVTRASGAAIAGVVAVSGAEATFRPALPFPGAASLTVILGPSVKSTRGGALGAPLSWSFTTAHWQPMATGGAPTARTGHSAVWTGADLVVWGGTPATLAGGRYRPNTDSWRPTAVAGAPAARDGHSAVWTGNEMIAWGGRVSGAPVATGGRYDPATDTWRAVSTTGAPTARAGHVAVWTGSVMIVWGGVTDLSGGRYDPGTDAWLPVSAAGAPVIEFGWSAAWTGTRMVVLGSVYDFSGGAGIPQPTKAVGALYDPVADAWTPMTTTFGAGSAMLWSGAELFVTVGNAGGRYDPGNGTWIALAQAGAPSYRANPLTAWTGDRLIVWSGVVPAYVSPATLARDGGVYSPTTDTWSPMPVAGADPGLQLGAVSAWSGTELLVWGGQSAATGARYTP
jgi:Bacterial Ig-like domain